MDPGGRSMPISMPPSGFGGLNVHSWAGAPPQQPASSGPKTRPAAMTMHTGECDWGNLAMGLIPSRIVPAVWVVRRRCAQKPDHRGVWPTVAGCPTNVRLPKQDTQVTVFRRNVRTPLGFPGFLPRSPAHPDWQGTTGPLH